MTRPATARSLWGSGRDRAALLALTVAGLCLAAFFAVADSVPEHEGLSLYDVPVARWFAAHRSVELGDLGLMLAKATSPAVLAVGLVVTVVLLRTRDLRREAVLLAGAVVVAEGLSLVIKYVERRPRPVAPVNLAPETEPSFPSGHVLVAATILAVGVVLAWPHLSRAGRVVAVVVAGIGVAAMSLDRLVVGAHWLTDVVASLALAGVVTALTVVVSLAWRGHDERARADLARKRSA